MGILFPPLKQKKKEILKDECVSLAHIYSGSDAPKLSLVI